MKIDILREGKLAYIELDAIDVEKYPTWQDTPLAHVKIRRTNKWTDIWLSVLEKNGRMRFCLSHQKGYPSENKGTAQKFITANWLSDALPNDVKGGHKV